MRIAVVLLVAARLRAATGWEAGFRNPAAQ